MSGKLLNWLNRNAPTRVYLWAYKLHMRGFTRPDSWNRT